MNLDEQIGALEAGVDQINQLIEAAATPQAETTPASATQPGNAEATAEAQLPAAAPAESDTADAANAIDAADQPTLKINRPNRDEITMTIGDQTVSLHPTQVGQLIEELANARASMQPEPPANLPPGWRFVSTKNPVMAVQKQSNGDRLLVMRHTGHGWVPFTFSPDMVIQLYMLLTQR
ncbi:hypothetical protein [Paraburkholderia megapolitana]|uniref:Phage tail protein n=1 Tax=Paraburkholderia megapolitana TaxID=420953 RepID=A0A1I3L2A4_9BURK|nr:hypothetical protein [Paraburkholderia megapolitana]QDQ80535.1 hypothetical protein FNZ07_04805 [Paraburkholderia megapolitana]SFI78814.1 hypothetical protein SAMN05192543_104218 [Paraburkholderia megapolitana]